MTIFKSHQVNLDDRPWIHPDSYNRYAEASPEDFLYLPRPEFEPTRDPEPWRHPDGRRWPFEGDDTPPFMNYEWAPRREQFDTPVNRVLVEFRSAVFTTPHEAAIFWVDWLADGDERWTSDEIEHARKVLTRLAGWKP